jgi:methyl-accepting chemotaxis protein
MTIRKNILFWLVLPIIIIGVITVGTIYYFVSKTVKQNIFDQLELAANTLQENVHRFLQEKRTRTIDFSSDGFIREYTKIITEKKSERENYTTDLNTHLSINKLPIGPDILEVFVVDLDGKIISSTEISRIGKEVSGENYFSKTMKNGSSISDLHYSQIFRQNTFELSRLLFDKEDQKTIGIIVNRYRGDSIWKVIRSGIQEELGQVKQMEGWEETTKLYIINSDKLMITGSRFLEDTILKRVVDTAGVRAALENGTGMIGIYTDSKGIPVLGASRYFEEMDWVVLAEKDVSEAFAPIVRLRNITIIIAIAGIIVIVTIAIILASGITKPIRKLVEGTRRISKEDYAYNIEPTVKDEVEYLTRTFNDMSSLLIQTKKQLQDYENNLEKKVEDKTKEVTIKARQQEIVAEIGKLLWTNLDIQDIMDRMVIRVSMTLKVEFCLILLLDKSKKFLRLTSGVGWKEGLVGHATLGVGLESIEGCTLKELKPIVIRDFRTETRFSDSSFLRKHGVVSGISVPMVADGRVIGVIGVHTTQLKEFSNDDINFIRLVGYLIAAGIESKKAYMDE